MVLLGLRQVDSCPDPWVVVGQAEEALAGATWDPWAGAVPWDQSDPWAPADPWVPQVHSWMTRMALLRVLIWMVVAWALLARVHAEAWGPWVDPGWDPWVDGEASVTTMHQMKITMGEGSFCLQCKLAL